MARKIATKSNTVEFNSGVFMVLHNSARIVASRRMVKKNPLIRNNNSNIRFNSIQEAVEALQENAVYTFMGHKQEKIAFRIMNMDTLEIVKSFSLTFNPALVEL